jgi:ABC-type polysaccharide/polyol phosphate transport system ATPase subunit
MAAITFDRVSKQFTLHHERARSFQELFLNLLHLGQNSPPATLGRVASTKAKERFWALRNVSFEIESGDMVGIIGPNGAGKSTVLKLVTRIIEPSAGKIAVNGRISALLELGAGFHPDLTGRENVYLNGSILGFSKAEMDCIFDEIVGFSEMDRFIDVPVKHYSSGMYMRLAFAIAINVRPDILLVDEVLAVGDQAFQARCLDRISEMKRRGVTIVLVTHDLDAVRSLCDRAIWLDEGKIQAEGAVDRVVEQYLNQVHMEDEQILLTQISPKGRGQAEAARSEEGPKPVQGVTEDSQECKLDSSTKGDLREVESDWRWGSREGEITKVQLLDGQGQERRSFKTGDTFVVRIHYAAHQRIDKPQFGLALFHAGGFHINGPNTVFSGVKIDAIEGQGYIDHVVDSLPLLEGTYLVSVSLYDYAGVHAYDYHHQAYTFRVHLNPIIREKYGVILIPSSWRLGPTGSISNPIVIEGDQAVEDEPSPSIFLPSPEGSPGGDLHDLSGLG